MTSTKAPAIDKSKLPERYRGAKRAGELIQEGMILKKEMDKKIEGSVANRLEVIKEELASIQVEAGLDGLRHGRQVFISRLFDGRVTTNIQAVKTHLIEGGVDIDVVNAAFAAGTKEGSPFWKREFAVIKE